MQINRDDHIGPLFKQLPLETRKTYLKLIRNVNEQHLHCNDPILWKKVHYIMTQVIAIRVNAKELKKYSREKKKVAALNPAANPAQAQAAVPAPVVNQAPGQVGLAGNPSKGAQVQNVNQKGVIPPDLKQIKGEMHQENYDKLLKVIKSQFDQNFHDFELTNQLANAVQKYVMSPLVRNRDLVSAICDWISLNRIYLPLGPHLLSVYKKDMAGETLFAKKVMQFYGCSLCSEALSKEAVNQVNAFLSEAAQIFSRSAGKLNPPTENTAVILCVKNGAGGHTAPAQAMATRLEQLGWKTQFVNYDEHLSQEGDPYHVLGLTFEDGSPMSAARVTQRWTQQKHKKAENMIVNSYIEAMLQLKPDLIKDFSGDDLYRNILIPLNPRLILSTISYHWMWKQAYRLPYTKTLLAASDVFFAIEPFNPWYRQLDFPEELRRIHFTAMTDDIELLKSLGKHHYAHWSAKHPNSPIESWIDYFDELKLDPPDAKLPQIFPIGAPIHPAFGAVTDPEEIKKLRVKWGVAEGAMCVCISRGRLGYDTDLGPAIESYRTTEVLPRPVEIHVVCGENELFYQKLVQGAYKDLGPNIKVVPHPLLSLKDFAELRAISTLDDIKAGGGSTFEGWYLISQGSQTLLLLTPGPELWWENSNCEAMEKWGVGVLVKPTTNKIDIINNVIRKGLPQIVHRFQDWRPPFDKCVELLAPTKR